MMRAPKVATSLSTAHGTIRLPAFVPVTTFGNKYPLDDLVRPYLPRLAQALMVSFHYAKQMKEHPTLPVFLDSGGFASLFQNVTVHRTAGLGVIEMKTEGKAEAIHPRDVLELQEHCADVAFTLDFPIPPGMSVKESRRRLSLTVANARWAIENRRRKDMLLFGCVQGWDVESYTKCARSYVGLPFDGIAIGGLVPRVHDLATVLRIIKSVRKAIPHKPLHVFGLGKPGIVDALFTNGVQSVDSSSYLKLAADGKLWGQSHISIPDASPAERLHLALCNLAMAAQRALPLSTSHLLFNSELWERLTPPSTKKH